mmetsp:Transcript_16068/g.24218  ORF Transcript_16068/g.24218 Transcript_16068/m.24218 type:complete len:190 (-) Transcript_16068:193-762(-)
MQDIIARARLLVEPERKREWYEEVEQEVCSLFPEMTYQQRLIGCFSCIAFGFLLSMGSLFRLVQLLEGNPGPFALMYSIGNIVALCASCFLYGPWSQIKKMFAFTRIVTTVVYLTMLGLTLFLALYPGDIPLRVLFLVFSIFLQFLALIWYTISFIPFARDMVKNCCITACCQCDACKDKSWQDFGNSL